MGTSLDRPGAACTSCSSPQAPHVVMASLVRSAQVVWNASTQLSMNFESGQSQDRTPVLSVEMGDSVVVGMKVVAWSMSGQDILISIAISMETSSHLDTVLPHFRHQPQQFSALQC